MISVGIDITATLYGRGVSRYTSNLVRALLLDPQVKLSLYGSSLRQHSELKQIATDLKKQAGSKAATVIRSYPPSLYRFLWNKIGYAGITSVLPDIEVFHSWDWLQPPDKKLALVSTIHDLAILKFPETAHPKILTMHTESWNVLKKRNAEIIAVSRSTQRDIVELLGIPEERVHVIHEALPQEVITVADSISDDEEAALITKLKLERPFILFVGTREPRKNLLNLITAWLPLQDQVDLLVAGEVGWDTSETSAPKSEHLRFLGRVSDRELSVLYTQATLFAYPSLYEGFGLPILEAFYHGTPVVTSATSSMPEIAGNAAELVDPLEPESIRQGIQTILDENEQEQQKRAQRMIIRQHMFSWERVASETRAVYERARQNNQQ